VLSVCSATCMCFYTKCAYHCCNALITICTGLQHHHTCTCKEQTIFIFTVQNRLSLLFAVTPIYNKCIQIFGGTDIGQPMQKGVTGLLFSCHRWCRKGAAQHVSADWHQQGYQAWKCLHVSEKQMEKENIGTLANSGLLGKVAVKNDALCIQIWVISQYFRWYLVT